jgi:hypothetical protein
LRAPRSIAALLAAACVLPATACTNEGEPAPVATAPTPGATTSPAEATTAPATPAVRRLAVRIESGRVDPAPGRHTVREGESVLIEVTSDVADTVHVHGYDLEAGVEAGGTATLEFVADRQGLFDVETHDTHLTLFQLQVR